MVPETGTVSARDGLELALYRWPLEAPRATCLLIHGYAEHVGRHEALAEALGSAGLEVWAIDLRGHGRSPGPRADVRHFADYIDDVTRLADRITSERPGLPRVVFGHSMGGTIALRYALEHPDHVSPLVLSSPFVRLTHPSPPWLTALAPAIARLAPQLPVMPIDASVLSRDPAEVRAYRTDRLTYNGWAKARMGDQLVKSGPPLLERASALDAPVLIVHGAADRLNDPEASRELAATIGDGDVTLKIYEGAYHELLHDDGRQAVMADILAWLAERLPSAGAA